MSMSAFSFGRLSASVQAVFVVLLFSLSFSVSAQITQTLGSLDVDRLGAAVYTLPIAAPSGMGGVKPNIIALYNSQAASGLLGKGGSICGLSVIKRCQQTLVRDGINKAISWTAEDRFCVDTQRLMLVAGTQGIADSQYKTEIDNGVVYTAKGGTAGNPDYFEARAEDGATLVFGGVATAKEHGAATMTWALSQYKDSANNAIEYVYEGTAADGLRIKRINYAFPVPNTTSNPGAYIEFIYKDRDDPISKYVAGYEFRTNKLLTQINSYSLLGLLYRSYQFDLATSSGLAGYVTRWQSFKECTSTTNCFEFTQFEWGRTQKNATTNQIETKNIKMDYLGTIRGGSKSAQLHSYENEICCNVYAADLNANGISELLWIQSGANNLYGYVASFDGASLANDSPKYVSAVPYSNSTDRYNMPLSFADINADGFLDIINPLSDTDSGGRRFWGLESISRSSNTWLIDYFAHRQLSTLTNSVVKPFDLNGDGFQELLAIDDRSVDFTHYKANRIATAELSTPNYRWLNYETNSLHLSDIPTANSIFVEYRNDMVASGDFNGDGKKDLRSL